MFGHFPHPLPSEFCQHVDILKSDMSADEYQPLRGGNNRLERVATVPSHSKARRTHREQGHHRDGQIEICVNLESTVSRMRTSATGR